MAQVVRGLEKGGCVKKKGMGERGAARYICATLLGTNVELSWTDWIIS
jgi:hypothetical protein